MKSLFCHNGIKVDPRARARGLVGQFLTSCSMRVCHSFSGFLFFWVGGVSFSILEKIKMKSLQ
jgi:hypothetical protein